MPFYIQNLCFFSLVLTFQDLPNTVPQIPFTYRFFAMFKHYFIVYDTCLVIYLKYLFNLLYLNTDLFDMFQDLPDTLPQITL
jgi:hypothetical protein